MKTPLRNSHIDTLAIGRRYILSNFKYEEFRLTDEMYYLTYLAKDMYDSDVELVVTIDLLTVPSRAVSFCIEMSCRATFK